MSTERDEPPPEPLPEPTPAGEGEHVVAPGECVSSLAYRSGHSPESIWKHPGNEALRKAREDLNVLLPGDRVHVPEIQQKNVDAGVDAKHRFRRRGVPERLRIKLLDDEGEPRGKVAFVFEVGGKKTEGETSRVGELDLFVPPDAVSATLRLGEGETLEIYQLELGHLDPADTPSGARARLVNLGYLWPEQQDEATLRFALRALQLAHELTVSGDLDEDTVRALVHEHGS